MSLSCIPQQLQPLNIFSNQIWTNLMNDQIKTFLRSKELSHSHIQDTHPIRPSSDLRNFPMPVYTGYLSNKTFLRSKEHLYACLYSILIQYDLPQI